MKLVLFLLASCLSLQALEPQHIWVLYREQDPSSRKLAETYAKGRQVPAENLIGLSTPEAGTISRTDYNKFIRDPLIQKLDEKKKWTRGVGADGRTLPLSSEIRVLLLMRGLPYRIERTPTEKGPDGKPVSIPPGQQDEASVDSELAFLGIKDAPIVGPLNNPYYNSSSDFVVAQIHSMFLTCRIDGPTVADCERMMSDALEVEKTGLWGFCYLDQAKKGKGYEAGDDWLRAIAYRNRQEGIPTIMDDFPDTLPTNYPMSNAALYFGWYAHHRNGPLLNPAFKFKQGAIAVHLHSFSASDLRDPKKRWTGPTIAAGATATLGNVWEPYLTLTHNFEIFHDRLLEGLTLVEAAHMAIPAHSWQSLVIGDPLYTPFSSFYKNPKLAEDNREFRAFRLAQREWGRDESTFVTKLRTAAANMNSGVLYEAIGLHMISEGKTEEAIAFFNSAARVYSTTGDKLRQTLHIVSLHRTRGEKELALRVLAEARETFAGSPEEKALIGVQNILNPPAPGPAKPKKAR